MMSVKFSQFKESEKVELCTTPHCVFVTLNPDDETYEQVVERQDKFLQLPENIKDKLVASETAEKIKNIGKNYNLELLQMAPIARVIRNYYFGDVSLEDFADIIEKESKVTKEEAQNISEYVIDRIINKNIKPIVTVKKEKIAIAQAMEKYPEIKKQALSSYPIEVERRRVNPTVENWINDYFSVVGAGNRDVMKRSSYLYHSKNIKGLNATERQKLSRVLKSLDDNSPLDIDIEKREIVFDTMLEEGRRNVVTEINKNIVGSSQSIVNSSQINTTLKVGPQLMVDGSQKKNKSNTQNSEPSAVNQELFQESTTQNNVPTPEKIEKTPAVNAKRFMDGFTGAGKKEVERKDLNQVAEANIKTEEINPVNKNEIIEKKKGNFDFLIGNKKRDEFDKKVPQINNTITPKKEEVQADTKDEKRMINRIARPLDSEGKKMTIRHVRGNNWDLGSAHFLKENMDKQQSSGKIDILEKSDNNGKDLEKASADDIANANIKFTSPQQLPVEKENNNIDEIKTKKNTVLDGFFGKIKPIE